MPNYNVAKLIEIVDPQAGVVREAEFIQAPPSNLAVLEAPTRSGRRMTLQEVAENNLSIFPTLLRDGLRAITYDSYAGTPQTWNLWAQTQPSDKLSEDWLEESGIGILPEVSEGSPYPFIMEDLDRTVNIANSKRGGRIKVTEEMIFFNRTGVLRQQAQQLGRAMATTKEQIAYNTLTTTGNYVRNSTTGDNDIGANTAATTFSALGLELAFSTLQTMKDRKSGIYLGIRPDTLICGPRLQFAATQLLMSPEVSRVGGNTTNDVYGTGTTNPWRGAVTQIIVSPFVQSYAWVLMERMRAVVYQTVWPFQLLQSGMTADSPDYVSSDTIVYRGREFFGFGMLNDRFAYYSSSSTAPIAA